MIQTCFTSGSLMKYVCSFFTISALIALTACGFKPMAATYTNAYDDQSLPAAMASVRVEAASTDTQRLLGQNFRIALEDLIDPSGGASTGSAYVLQVSLEPYIQPGLIAPDGKAQRFLVSLNSSYVLKRLSDGAVLDNGRLNRSSSYSNLPNSYFSTYIAEQDTIKRMSKELAEQYRMKLASILASLPSEPGEIAPSPPPIYIRPEQAISVPFGQ